MWLIGRQNKSSLVFLKLSNDSVCIKNAKFLFSTKGKPEPEREQELEDEQDKTDRPFEDTLEDPLRDTGGNLKNDDDTRALVRATVPDFVPELVSLPVTRRPVFPGFYKTISVRDKKVASTITSLLRKGRPYLGLFLNRDETRDTDCISNLNEIYKTGVFAQIINTIQLPADGGVTAIVYPHRRIIATDLLPPSSNGMSRVRVENLKDEPYDKRSRVLRAITQEIFAVMADVAKLNAFFREHITHHNVPSTVFEDAAKLADFVAVLTSSESSELQEVLETTNIEERLRKCLILLKKELVTAQLQAAISKDVEAKLNQKQREYFLHEQLKSIKKELGLETDSKEKLLQQFRERAEKLQFPEAVRKVFDEEISKLSVLEPAGAEFNVTRNYLDWITQLPWGKRTTESFDPDNASAILDEDHYGLADVKERILEFIAVGKLRGSMTGKILCLVGPPGVGKTSVGKSIARALNREYFRFSVGGLGDVAEIKGHRRTYVGAMPGKVVQALKKVQSENPLILIDEIDKIGKGHTGDPSSALLELLDPEQNGSFVDHYLDVPVNLGNVLFMCTANSVDTIPAPLLDRMEVINLSGYVAQEKMQIATKFLIPNARKESGLKETDIVLENEAIDTLIRNYCRESGVRNLKKHIEKILRKAALKIVKGAEVPLTVKISDLSDYLGNPPFVSDRLFVEKILPPGVVMGLAYTQMGGAVLYVETVVERLKSGDGKGSFIRTGQLGKVMEESASIAYSYVKSFLNSHYQSNRFFDNASIHLHVPEGATPKDGPSAGCTMAASLVSLALNKGIQGDLSMTGELTLTGKILRIGGVKEKTIAAKRSGVIVLLLPRSNESDWLELPDFIREGLTVHFVDTFKDVAKHCGLLDPESNVN